MSDKNRDIPQAGMGKIQNPTNSNREKALVVGAGSTDSGVNPRILGMEEESRSFQEKIKLGKSNHLVKVIKCAVWPIESNWTYSTWTASQQVKRWWRPWGKYLDKEMTSRSMFFDQIGLISSAVLKHLEGPPLTLLKKGKIRLGQVYCRIRQRIKTPQCYQCLSYGHIKTHCKRPDRNSLCWKCGKQTM